MDQFIKLKSTTNLVDTLHSFALRQNTTWIHKNAFDIAVVPHSLVQADNVISKLLGKFKAVPVIFRMEPMQFYRFHVDAARYSALNLLLSGKDSQTYFATETADEEILNLTELNYDDNCFYLLNTQAKHGVVNRHNTRYMFSLGFEDDYTTLKKFIEDNNL